AVATGHEHWLKALGDVVPITGPLNAWIDQLPSKTIKRLEKNLAPCLFVTGCAIVVGPDLVAEMRLRAETKRALAAVSRTNPRAAAAPHPSASGATGPSNGASRCTGGAGGWAGSIPATPPG